MKKISFIFIFILVIVLSLTACTIKDEEPNNSFPTEEKTDIKGIVFESKSFVYDGYGHSLFISGILPSGVSVEYANNNKVNVGEYEVTATFNDSTGKYNVPDPMKAKLTILPKELSGISFEGATIVYDGDPHYLEISGILPNGVSVNYENNGQINVGEYEVIAKLIDSTGNYDLPKELSATLKITPKEIDWISFESKTFAYDGNPHSLAITGELPEGVIVEYTNNGQTEANKYDVIATFTDTTGNYIVPKPMSAELIIYNAGEPITITFIFDDHKETVSILSGSILESIPEIPNREGYRAKWDYDFTLPIYFDLTCNILYDLIIYNIDYILPEGVENNPNNVTTYTCESDTIILYDLESITGYHFGGWYIDKNLADDSKIESIPSGSIGNLTLYAKWEAKKYTITYITNGGTLETTTQVVTYDSEYELYEISRVGYIFIGYTNNDVDIAMRGIWKLDEDVTIEAKWEAKKYTITYITNGGTLESTTQIVAYDSEYELYEISRQGYTFIGYTKDNDFFEKSGVWNIDENITLEAHWEAKEYTITYVPNGGDLESMTQVVTYDSEYELYEISRLGYTFIGYMVDEAYLDITGVWKIADNVTIEAMWEAKEYTITYVPNGGYLESMTQVVTYDSEYELYEITRVGYTFICYTNNDVAFAMRGIWNLDENITLTAHWEAKEYTITYVPNGGDLETTTQVVTFDSEYELYEITRVGYTFVCYTNNDLEIEMTGIWKIADDVAIEAMWEAKEYTITYVPNGGDLETTTQVVTFDSEYELYEIIRLGYTFIGYMVDEAYLDITGIWKIADNVTIEAMWEAKEYTITYVPNGGDLESMTQVVTYDSEYELYEIIRRGYTFIGYIFADTIFAMTGVWEIASDITLEATWQINEYLINYYYEDRLLGTESVVFESEFMLKDTVGDHYIEEWIFNDNIYTSGTTLIYDFDFDIELIAKDITYNGNDFVLEIDEENKTAIIIDYVGVESNLVIPSVIRQLDVNYTITKIGKMAFYACESLVSVIFNGNLLSIGDNSFAACPNLESIILDGIIDTIGDSIFADCTKLKDVTIGCDMEELNGNLFSGCLSLESLAIMGNVLMIEAYAFSHFVNLENIHIEGNIGNIGALAFSGCSNLKNVVFGAEVLIIDSNAFYNCTSLESIVINGNIGSIKENAFSGCSSLESVAFYGNIDSIVEGVFYGCLSLSDLTIGGNIESIGDSAFYHCTSLTELTFGGDVGSIGGSAFSGCSSLTHIAFGGNVEYIERWAFNSCRSIELITIAGHAGTIAREAFWNCSSLISLTIGQEVESIGEGAFSGCSSLTTVTFGGDLRIVETYAFNNCKKLESITIKGNLESIGEWAFFGCFNLKSIVFGGNIANIGIGAFIDCSQLSKIYYKGSYADWQQINIAESNEPLQNATMYYYSEEQPSGDGNYWFYDEDGNIVIW